MLVNPVKGEADDVRYSRHPLRRRRAEPHCISLAKSMTDAIALSRARMVKGWHAESGVMLGHRRLAVIDPAGGQQPMFNEDQSVSIVFNGEIYNFETLRAELTGTRPCLSGTAVTPRPSFTHGNNGVPACVSNRLAGMFAFVVWDRNRQQFFSARVTGLARSLFYYGWAPSPRARAARDFVFGSELAALRPVANLDWRLRPAGRGGLLRLRLRARATDRVSRAFISCRPPIRC